MARGPKADSSLHVIEVSDASLIGHNRPKCALCLPVNPVVRVLILLASGVVIRSD